MKKERPFELKIVIIIALISGVLQILFSRYLLVNRDVLSDYQYIAYIGLIIAIVHLVVVIGLFKGFLWAWYIAIIGCSLYLLQAIVYTMLVYPDVFGIILNLGCLYLLTRNKVREYFTKKV